MKILYDQFGDRSDFGIASFTIDPEHDTPSTLKKYAEGYIDKSSSWNFLTTKRQTIYDLANTGFNIFASINPAVAGGFEHQGYFALIDKNGYIRSRQDDFGNPIVYYMGIDQEEVEEQDPPAVPIVIDDDDEENENVDEENMEEDDEEDDMDAEEEDEEELADA